MNGLGVDKEVRSLLTIKMRWAAPHSYVRPSFLEHPYRTDGGILEAIEWLQSSALDWGPVNVRDEGYTWEMERLHNVGESALSYFGEFRTVFRTQSLCMMQAEEAETSSYDGYGRIPTRIHRAVTSNVWRIHTTSLYDMSSPPSIDELKGAGIYVSAPLQDRHVVAIAALVCCFRAVNGFCRILDYWRGMFKQWLPRGESLHFDGNYADPEWEDLLMKLREDPANLLWETERRRDAFIWIDRAEAWLAYAEQLENVSKRIEVAKKSAAKTVLESVRKRRSEAAKKSLGTKKQVKEARMADAEKVWRSLQPGQRGSGGVGIVAKRLGVSVKTASRYLKELGYRRK